MVSYENGTWHRECEINPVTQQRFAASQADFLDTETDRNADHACDFFKRDEERAGHPLRDNGRGVGQVRPVTAIEILGCLRFRQAIHATEITAIREADAQVAQSSTVRVNQPRGAGHFDGAVGALVAGGITRTVPSELTSTFKS